MNSTTATDCWLGYTLPRLGFLLRAIVVYLVYDIMLERLGRQGKRYKRVSIDGLLDKRST
jgi:hypothetical protein